MSFKDDPIGSLLPQPLKTPEPDNRLRILLSAEEIISEKGFNEVTISEIARKAGVKDSIIYRYFKGKEDLLFSIPEERLKIGLSLLDRDLQGIIDPKSKLRKLIWAYLCYHNVYSAYARILLFECLSSTGFYSTPAYQLVLQYANRISSVLEQGVQEGKFRNDASLTAMGEIIHGTLDMNSISFLVLGETANPLSDFEDTAALVERMIAPRQEKPTSNSGKISSILDAAEKVFAQKGFNKARMTEIAKQAGVADGTVYEYFKNKDDLFFSIPKRRFEQYLGDMTEIFGKSSPVRKLKEIIHYHFSTCLADRHFTKIFVFNLIFNKNYYQSKVFDSFRNFYGQVEKVIEEGKTEGSFNSEVNPRVFRNMFLGTFYYLMLRWLGGPAMTKAGVTKEINQVIDLLLDAVITDKPRGGSVE